MMFLREIPFGKSPEGVYRDLSTGKTPQTPVTLGILCSIFQKSK